MFDGINHFVNTNPTGTQRRCAYCIRCTTYIWLNCDVDMLFPIPHWVILNPRHFRSTHNCPMFCAILMDSGTIMRRTAVHEMNHKNDCWSWFLWHKTVLFDFQMISIFDIVSAQRMKFHTSDISTSKEFQTKILRQANGGLYSEDLILEYQKTLTSPMEESIFQSRIVSAVKNGDALPAGIDFSNGFSEVAVSSLSGRVL